MLILHGGKSFLDQSLVIVISLDTMIEGVRMRRKELIYKEVESG